MKNRYTTAWNIQTYPKRLLSSGKFSVPRTVATAVYRWRLCGARKIYLLLSSGLTTGRGGFSTAKAQEPDELADELARLESDLEWIPLEDAAFYRTFIRAAVRLILSWDPLSTATGPTEHVQP